MLLRLIFDLDLQLPENVVHGAGIRVADLQGALSYKYVIFKIDLLNLQGWFVYVCVL